MCLQTVCGVSPPPPKKMLFAQRGEKKSLPWWPPPNHQRWNAKSGKPGRNTNTSHARFSGTFLAQTCMLSRHLAAKISGVGAQAGSLLRVRCCCCWLGTGRGGGGEGYQDREEVGKVSIKGGKRGGSPSALHKFHHHLPPLSLSPPL